MTANERGPMRSDTSNLTPGDILEVAESPVELAESLTVAEIRDRIAIWDEEAEIQNDIIRKAQIKRDSAQHRVHIAQEALRIANDRGLE